MKSEIRVSPHKVIPGANVVEIWHDGKFIGEVTGADGPGVRVISKYQMIAVDRSGPESPDVCEVRIMT